MKEMYYEEGARGQAKFNQYSRMLTVPFALVQAYGFLTLLISQGVITRPDPFDFARNVIVITCGSMIALWLGELITEQKIGNGISLDHLGGYHRAFAVERSASRSRPTRRRFCPAYIGFVVVGHRAHCGHRLFERRRAKNSGRVCAARARK